MEESQPSAYLAYVFPQHSTQVPYTVVHEFTCTPTGLDKCPHGNFLKGVKWSPDGCCMLTASDDGWLRIFDLPQDVMVAPAPALRPPPSDSQHATASTHPSGPVNTLPPVSAATPLATDPSSVPQPAQDGACHAQHACGNGAAEWGGSGAWLQGANTSEAGGEGCSPQLLQPPPWSRDQCDSLGVGLRVHEGETIYDFCWFPQMTATDPVSCCFASSSRAHPVHLWDACSGELRATYRGYNDADEVAAAYSLAFTPDGSQLYAGYERRILVFDVTRPGRDYGTIACSGGPRKGEAKLPGIISCMDFPPDGSSLSAGTYTGYVGIFDPRSPPHAQLQMLLHGHKGGLTQISYTQDGRFLVTGARQDDGLLVWDLRNADQALYRLERDTKTTNQRIGFSLEPCGRHLLTGGCNGAVRVFDLQTGSHVDELVVAEGDTVNGCDTHPFLSLLAVATGHRRLPVSVDALADSEDTSSSSEDEDDNASPQWSAWPQANPSVAMLQQHPYSADHHHRYHHHQQQQQQQQGEACPAQPMAGVGDCGFDRADTQGSDQKAQRQRDQRQKWSQTELRGITNSLRVLRMEHQVVPYPVEPPLEPPTVQV